MAKIAGLLKKIKDLETRLEACTEAYTELLDKYRKLYQKHSYEETMEVVKKIGEFRRKEGKIVL